MTPESMDPTDLARRLAKPDLPKRFYSAVALTEDEDGYGILLDGRRLKTPGRKPFAIASRPLAEAIVAEWDAQADVIDATTMPVTRLVNSALDGVTDRMEAVRSDVVAYAGNDLICYRAESPVELVARQAASWDPVLDWLRAEHDAPMVLAEGVIPVDQPERSLARIGGLVELFDPLALAALHSATTLTGSAFLALSLALGRLSAEAVWQAAHIDEDWQIAQWGEDAEARQRRERRWRDMSAAAFVLAERSR